jgi:CRP-like cAMP-binding protein
VGPDILSPNFARTSSQKSIFSLQTLESSTVARISVKKMDELRDTDLDIRRWGQKVIELELKKYFSHEIRFRSSNAKERLFKLRKDYPNLENRVPHSCIASYIGITPVSFSRLRNELSQENFLSNDKR